MKKPIYAYYAPNLAFPQNEESDCLNLWKTSWSQNQWEPVLLNRTHSTAHKLHDKLAAKLANDMKLGHRIFPLRYLRWCALSMAGGGWMSDYDVVNIALKPETCDQLEIKSPIHINAGRHAYFFYATREYADQAIMAFLENDLTSNELPTSEATIIRKPRPSKEFKQALNQVWHPHLSEPARSVQMAEYVDLEKKPIMLVPE